MSKYTYYYKLNQNRYKRLAINWKCWADTSSLTERDKEGMAKFFKPIARRFGLIKEFRNIGVI
jgi:hypothetical protein